VQAYWVEYCKIQNFYVQRKGMIMAWLLLFSAGFVEIIFALSLKYNEGFTKLWPSIITALSGIGSFGLLMWAIKTLPLGTAYAVWTGIGAVGVAILGIFLFKESVDWMRLVSIGLVIVGIVGLKLTDSY
jgi:quaternary ammonium compound-resistance protein SugE